MTLLTSRAGAVVFPGVPPAGPFPEASPTGKEVDTAVIPPGVNCVAPNASVADKEGRLVLKYDGNYNLAIIPLDCVSDPTSAACAPRVRKVLTIGGPVPLVPEFQFTTGCSKVGNGACQCTGTPEAIPKVTAVDSFTDSQIFHAGNGVLIWMTFSGAIRYVDPDTCAMANPLVRNGWWSTAGRTATPAQIDACSLPVVPPTTGCGLRYAGAVFFRSDDCGETWAHMGTADPTLPGGADSPTSESMDAYRGFVNSKGKVFFAAHDQFFRFDPFSALGQPLSYTRVRLPAPVGSGGGAIATPMTETYAFANGPSATKWLVASRCGSPMGLGERQVMSFSSTEGNTWTPEVVGLPCSGPIANGGGVLGLNLGYANSMLAPDFSPSATQASFFVGGNQLNTRPYTNKQWLGMNVQRFAIDAAGNATPGPVTVIGGPDNHVWRTDLIAAPKQAWGTSLGGPALVYEVYGAAPGGAGQTIAPFPLSAMYLSNWNGTKWSGPDRPTLKAYPTVHTVSILFGSYTYTTYDLWTGSFLGTKLVNGFSGADGDYDRGASLWIPGEPAGPGFFSALPHVRYFMPITPHGVSYTFADVY